MAMKTAFCCVSLLTGTLIVGWLTLVLYILGVTFYTVTFAFVQAEDGETENNSDRLIFGKIPLPPTLYHGIYYGVSAIDTIVLLLLLYGTYKDRRGFLIPYLVITGIEIIAYTLLVIFWFVLGLHWLYSVKELIAIPIGIYFFCIVRSYYAELSPGNWTVSENQAVYGKSPV